MKNKFIRLWLFTVTLLFIQINVFAMTGSGTSKDPYMIYNTADFKLIKNNKSAHYKLANDITIGQDCAITGTFDGVFDGNGYSLFVTMSMNPHVEHLFEIISRTGVLKNFNLVSDVYKGNFDLYKKNGPVYTLFADNYGLISNIIYGSYPRLSSNSYNFKGKFGFNNYGTIEDVLYIRQNWTASFLGSNARYSGFVDDNQGIIRRCELKLFSGTSGECTLSLLADNNDGTIEDCSIYYKQVSRSSSDDTSIFSICRYNNGTVSNVYVVFEPLAGLNYDGVHSSNSHNFSNSVISNVHVLDTSGNVMLPPVASDVGKITVYDDSQVAYFKSQQFVDKLNSTSKYKKWKIGNNECPYPMMKELPSNLSISVNVTKFGDNTNANLTVTTSRDATITLKDSNGTVHDVRRSSNKYVINLNSLKDGVYTLKAEQVSNGIRISESNSITINKLSVLSNLLAEVSLNNGAQKIIVVNESGRVFDNNSANQALINKLKLSGAKFYFIGNNISSIFNNLIN